MKVNEILKEALSILGLDFNNLMSSASFLNDSLSLVNLALVDIGKERLKSLEDAPNLSEKEIDVLIYGVARGVTLYLGDTVKNGAITDIYNAKRRSILSSIGKIKNVEF